MMFRVFVREVFTKPLSGLKLLSVPHAASELPLMNALIRKVVAMELTFSEEMRYEVSDKRAAKVTQFLQSNWAQTVIQLHARHALLG